MPFGAACIPPLPVQAGAGFPGWTGQVSLPRGGLPALRQTAWGRPEDDFNEKTLHLSCNFGELLTLAEMNLKSVKNALYLLLLLARALA